MQWTTLFFATSVLFAAGDLYAKECDGELVMVMTKQNRLKEVCLRKKSVKSVSKVSPKNDDTFLMRNPLSGEFRITDSIYSFSAAQKPPQKVLKKPVKKTAKKTEKRAVRKVVKKSVKKTVKKSIKKPVGVSISRAAKKVVKSPVQSSAKTIKGPSYYPKAKAPSSYESLFHFEPVEKKTPVVKQPNATVKKSPARKFSPFKEVKSDKLDPRYSFGNDSSRLKKAPKKLETGALDDVPAMQKPAPLISSNEKIPAKINKIMRTQKKRKGSAIFQLPLAGPKKQQTLCGMRHLRGLHAPLDRGSSRTRRTQPYMTPTAACMMTGVANEWREKFCPGNDPHCQILVGDAGHNGHPRSWPHKSHKGGDCVDLWVMRKKTVGNSTVNYTDSLLAKQGTTGYGSKYYSRSLTNEFMKLLVKWGAETTNNRARRAQFFFGDPKLIASRRLGISKSTKVNRVHKDHIHVCFRNNKRNRRKCNSLKVSPNFCPMIAEKNGYRPARRYVSSKEGLKGIEVSGAQ